MNRIKGIFFNSKLYSKWLSRYVYAFKLHRALTCARKQGQRCIILMATPCHANIGDHAIVYAQRLWMQRHLENVSLHEITAARYYACKGLIEKCLSPSDIIVIDGGGNLGTLWEKEDDRISDIMARFKRQRIIVFPQTCYYDESAEGRARIQRNQAIYRACESLTVSLRERRSYDYFREHFPSTDALLMPDIVLSIESLDIEEQREGCLLCFRDDHESVLSEEERLQVVHYLESQSMGYRFTRTHAERNFDKDSRDEQLEAKLREFASARLVITDRLHGMIFAVITGTPCLVLDNVSRKVSGNYEWIESLDYVQLHHSLPELLESIAAFWQKGEARYDNAAWAQLYEQLLPLFDTSREGAPH